MISFLISREQLSKWVMGERSWWSPLVRNHPVLRPAAHKVTQIREVSTNHFQITPSFLQKIPVNIKPPPNHTKPRRLPKNTRVSKALYIAMAPKAQLSLAKTWFARNQSLDLNHLLVIIGWPHWYPGAQKYSATLVSKTCQVTQPLHSSFDQFLPAVLGRRKN